MLLFISQRIFQSLLVMMTVAFIAFSLFSYVGDPVNNLVGQDTTLEDRQVLREQLGLNDNFLVQFGRFVKNVTQGDFGTSYRHRRPVSELIVERLPATLELALLSSVVALIAGVAMGVYTALNVDGVVSKLLMSLSLLGVSLPTFLIGLLLIFVFGVVLQWLPSFGRGEVVQIGWWSSGLFTVSGLKALIMPTITLALFQMTLIMRLVRAEMLEVLRMDFIKFAKARGLSDRAIHLRHALKNTMVPVITITGLQLGSIIAFAIITESVFQWPGMGLLFIQAISEVDIPVMAAYLVMIAAFFVTINFIVDILYLVVDPRLRIDKTSANA